MRESEEEPHKKVKTNRSKKRDKIGKIKMEEQNHRALASTESNEDDASFKAIGLIPV